MSDRLRDFLPQVLNDRLASLLRAGEIPGILEYWVGLDRERGSDVVRATLYYHNSDSSGRAIDNRAAEIQIQQHRGSVLSKLTLDSTKRKFANIVFGCWPMTEPPQDKEDACCVFQLEGEVYLVKIWNSRDVELAKRQLTKILAKLVFAELGEKQLTWGGITLMNQCIVVTDNNIAFSANIGLTHTRLDCQFEVIQQDEVPEGASAACKVVSPDVVELMQTIFGVKDVSPPLTHIAPKPTCIVGAKAVHSRLDGALIVCFVNTSVDVKSALEEKALLREKEALTKKLEREKKEEDARVKLAAELAAAEGERLALIMERLQLQVRSLDEMKAASAAFKRQQASREQEEWKERERLKNLELAAERKRRDEERKVEEHSLEEKKRIDAEQNAAVAALLKEQKLAAFRAKNVKGGSGSSSQSSSRDGSPPPPPPPSNGTPPPHSNAVSGGSPSHPPSSGAKGGGGSPSPPPSSGAKGGGGAKGCGGKSCAKGGGGK